MHPFEQVWIVGPVGPAVRGDAVHPPVDSPYPVDCALGVVSGPEGRDRQECAGSLQPTPRVGAIIGVLGDTGHCQGCSDCNNNARRPPTNIEASACTRRIGRSSANQRGPGLRGSFPGSAGLGSGDHLEKSAAQSLPDLGGVEGQLEVEVQGRYSQRSQ